MTNEQQSVEQPNIPDGTSGNGSKENGLVLYPVSVNTSGEGLPYAPVDWPCLGDVWGWKVGKRVTHHGFMADRYLYLPSRLKMSMKGKSYFASLQSVKEFLRKEFPDTNIESFLASFSWKVPSKDHFQDSSTFSRIPMHGMAGDSGLSMKCKARNKLCSLEKEENSYPVPAMECNICCSEAGFCRDCCCILCSRNIDLAYDSYSFIRCEAKLSENNICGHAGHLDCALRSYMAGTVGGSIGLDVEYYCRRCDHRTDLISHVARLLKTCESLDSRDDVEKILKLGLCILRGSERETPKRLLSHIDLALTKITSGVHLPDVWNMEDNTSMDSAGELAHLSNNGNLSELEAAYGQHPHGSSNTQRRHEEAVFITSDHHVQSIKLEGEIEQVLQDLKRSQEMEYRMAEDKLYAQKDLLIALYQQLDAERSELAAQTASSMDCDVDGLLTNISNIISQIKKEVGKLKEMEEVAKGFGRTAKIILHEHFGFLLYD